MEKKFKADEKRRNRQKRKEERPLPGSEPAAPIAIDPGSDFSPAQPDIDV